MASTLNKSNTSSNTSSRTKSNTQQQQTSQQYGGSNSTTNQAQQGGSSTISRSHTEGGSHSESYGKSAATGTVEKYTQQQRQQALAQYSEGQKVQDTYARLQETLNGKPGAFQSTFTDRLNNIYDQIMNREKFNYNFNADPMYQQYKDQYTAAGRNAMRDTMGQASALTGGYSNSYAQTAGQQQYQNYLQQLNNILPELRNQAYQQYMNEGQELLNRYNITSDAYNRDYSQYRDTVGDWQSDRSFNQGAYQDERNFDWNQYQANRSFWNDEYWNERNAERTNWQTTDTSNWSDTVSESNTSNWSNSQSDTAATNWSGSASRSNSTTDSRTNSATNSNTNSFSYSDSAGSGRSGSSGTSSATYDFQSVDVPYTNNQYRQIDNIEGKENRKQKLIEWYAADPTPEKMSQIQKLAREFGITFTK